MGVKPGEPVAIAMRNCPDWILTFAAAVHVGAIPVLINSWGSAEELEFTLRDSDPTVLAADLPRTSWPSTRCGSAELPVAVQRRRRWHRAFGPRPAVTRVDLRPIRDAVVAGRGRDYATTKPEPEDMAMLLYTSGSTGHPKGVVYRHISVGQALMNMMLSGFLPLELSGPIELRGGATAEAGLVTVPLFHATGLFSGFLVPCAVGQKVVLLRKWHAETAMHTIQTEKITLIATVPAILKDLLTHPRFDDYDLSSLSRVAAAGAATPAGLPELLRDKLGIENRSSGYGMTETTSVCATMSGPVFDLKPMAAGIVSPIIDVRVVDAEGTLFPPNGTAKSNYGALPSRPDTGNATTSPKKRSPPMGGSAPATLEAWMPMDSCTSPDGSRKSSSAAERTLAPAEIENVAYRHSSVKEVAVFGVPDDAMGEELAMVCHPQAGSTLTEDELRAHLRDALPTFKVPKYVALTDEPLPRNASEKIHRLALRNGFVANC